MDDLSSQGSDFEKRILTGATDVVNQIAQCGGKNWFVFATKYCGFVNPEKYPIYDSLVVNALEYFNAENPFYAEKISYEKIRQNGEYERFKNIIDEFRNKYCLDCAYKEMDKFLWLFGKNLSD